MEEDMIQLVVAIPIAKQTEINAAIAAQFPNSGSETFRSLFSSDGNDPATHVVCSWGLTPANKDTVVAFLTSSFSGFFEWDFVAIHNVQGAIFTNWGLRPVNNI